MWLGDISQRVWCFVPSLLTVVSQVCLFVIQLQVEVLFSTDFSLCDGQSHTGVRTLLILHSKEQGLQQNAGERHSV